MGEAIITSRSGGIAANGSSSAELRTEIFKVSDTFIAPKARNQQFSVRIFGGGGGGSGDKYDSLAIGGGGGWMNNAILTINQGDIVPVVIGKGGIGAMVGTANNISQLNSASNGGTTSFGTYLSALGGYGAATIIGSTKLPTRIAGSGGSGGGCYSGRGNGGTGYQFGGGGGSNHGGNGGKWGGGGGGHQTTYQSNENIPRGGCLYENSQNINEITGYSGLAGNGYANIRNGYGEATNGTNTIGNTEVPEALQGKGLCGDYYGGGGGYGGEGGIGAHVNPYNGGGGGGGYGANGGNYGGGGGGYGGHGGNYGGGGGSYGPGGDGEVNISTISASGVFGGGGAGRGNGGRAGNGGDGICIIQYYPA